MTIKEELYCLIDQMTDYDAELLLLALRDGSRMLMTALMAPYDDEQDTEEEEALIQEGRDALARGDVVPWEDVKRELGL